jgi:hypothetical protein
MKNSTERMMSLFAGLEDVHGTHGLPELDENGVKWGIKKTARTVREPVTLEMWAKHLEGKRPLGIVPIRRDSTSVWGSIDVDEYDIDALEVVKKVEAAKLPLVPCRSKSGGLHLFLFASEPVEAELMQGVLRHIAATLGFAGSEIFPKQTKILVDKGDHGSWMVVPYFGGDFGGKIRFQYGLKKTGAEMTLEEFLSFADKRKQSASDIAMLKASGNATPKKKTKTVRRAPRRKPSHHSTTAHRA